MIQAARTCFLERTLRLPLTVDQSASTSNQSHPALRDYEELLRTAVERAALWNNAASSATSGATSERKRTTSDADVEMKQADQPALETKQQPRAKAMDSALSSHFVELGGVLLQRRIVPESAALSVSEDDKLVPVDTTVQALHSVALALSEGKPILLEG